MKFIPVSCGPGIEIWVAMDQIAMIGIIREAENLPSWKGEFVLQNGEIIPFTDNEITAHAVQARIRDLFRNVESVGTN